MEIKNTEKKSINELYGIIIGINADEIINKDEIEYLKEWLNNNKNYESSSLFHEMYVLLKNVLEDSIITSDEKKALLKICDGIKEKFNSSKDAYGNLLGIIEGISCDKKINDKELDSLNNWLNHNQMLRGNLIFDNINIMVKNILADGIISSDEEKELLGLFDSVIITKREAMTINYLRALIKQGKNIGNNLIVIYNNETLVRKIHMNAKAELLKALNKSLSTNLLNTELIFISLCLIALKEYDGNFYDYVAEEYQELYDNYTRQRIDGIIRTIIKKYIKEDENATRQINYVLENTIVPQKFLPNYFDFIYDIYKVNFQFTINQETLNEDLDFVFCGLKDVFNDNSDEINIAVTKKTYKLIKSTKNLIYNNDSITELINFTKKIIQIIDKYYWENTTDISNNYYKLGFEDWINKNNKEITEKHEISQEERENIKSRWQPNFVLKDNEIYLHVPEHKIKNDYDYNELKIIIYENGEKKKEIQDFRVFEIIGGYRLEIPDIKIDNPLSHIQYKIISNTEIIYDSKDILANDFIIFNEKGISITPNRNYEGNIYIAYKENIDENVNRIFHCDNYNLGTTFVNNNSILKIENEFITFTSEIISGLVGTLYENTYIFTENKNIPVYKFIEQIIFETSTITSEIGMKINNKRYKLSQLEYINKEGNGKNTLFINYPISESGYYIIEFFNTITGKPLNFGKYEFYIDSILEYEIIKLDKDNYNIQLKSSLTPENKEYSLDIREYDNFKIGINNNEKAWYELPLEIPVYKIDEGTWKSVEDYIWIENININSNIYFKGINIDELLITTSSTEQLTKLKAYKKDNCYKVPIGTLRSYIGITDKINIFLTNKSKVKQYIECYTKCMINEKETFISFDSEKNELSIKIKIYGEGTFKFTIANEQGNILYEKSFDKNSITFKIKNLKSEKFYVMKILKVATGFSLDGDVELYSKKEKFYSYISLVNKNLKVKSVDFDIFDKYSNKLIRKTFYLHRTYFQILEYLGNKKFLANVYKWEGYVNYLNNLNPIEIELSSEIENENIEVAAYKDGDGLLIDFNNKTILNSLDDLKAPDIYSCNLIIRGME